MAATSRWSGRRMRYIALYALYFLLGTPLWWKTTEIFRAELPLETIAELEDVNAVSWPFHLSVRMCPPYAKDREKIVDTVENKVQMLPVVKEGNLNLRLSFDDLPECPKFDSESEVVSFALANEDSSAHHTLFLLATSNGPFDEGQTVLGVGSHSLIRANKMKTFATTPDFITKWTRVLQDVIINPNKGTEEKSHVAVSESIRLSFSLLNADAANRSFLWDANDAIARYFGHFMSALSGIVAFSVDSQVVDFVSLPVAPRSQVPMTMKIGEDGQATVKNNGESTFIFSKDELDRVLNIDELGVTPGMTRETATQTTVNFLTYLPSADQKPLHLVDEQNQHLATNAVLVPKWGGFAVYNANTTGASEYVYRVSSDELEPVFMAFLAQVRELVGLRSISDVMGATDYRYLPSPHGISGWEINGLLRYRTRVSLEATVDLLKNSAQVVEQISRLPVPQIIAEDVSGSLDSLEKAIAAINNGDIFSAHEEALLAQSLSHAAFFHPSMLALEAIPEEYKYAIYTPFFFPVIVNLLRSFVQEVKYQKHRWSVLKKSS